MLRRIVLGVAALAAVAASLAFTSSTEASPWGHRRHHVRYPVFQGHHCHFKVLYRDCHCITWSCYGTFHSSYEAERVASSLRHQGYDVRVAHF